MRLYPSATLLARFTDAISSLLLNCAVLRTSFVVWLHLLHPCTNVDHSFIIQLLVHVWGNSSTLENGSTQIIAELRGMAQTDDIAVNPDRSPESIFAYPASTTITASYKCS